MLKSDRNLRYGDRFYTLDGNEPQRGVWSLADMHVFEFVEVNKSSVLYVLKLA